MEYEGQWLAWWAALQPDWRDVTDWPFPQEFPTGGSWDKILIGGKDGIFIVMMTLSWWSIEQAKDEDESSQLDLAIEDVSWVLSNLNSVLSTGDSGPSLLPPSASRSPRDRKGKGKLQPRVPTRVGLPNKRRRLNKS